MNIETRQAGPLKFRAVNQLTKQGLKTNDQAQAERWERADRDELVELRQEIKWQNYMWIMSARQAGQGEL